MTQLFGNVPGRQVAKDEVNTYQYEFSSGHKPRGSGSWAFSTRRSASGGDKDIFWYNGSYKEAKAAAQRHFGNDSTIYLLP